MPLRPVDDELSPAAVPVASHRWRFPLLVLAFATYAALAIAGVLAHNAIWPVIGIFFVLTVLLWPALHARRRGAWLLWTAILVLFSAAAAAGVTRAALDALAVPINAAIGWVFARTLGPGREPLIARMVRQIEGPQRLAQPGVAEYARGLTAVWAWVLLGQAGVLLLIWLLLHGGLPVSISASAALWLQRYLSYGGYLLMALLFVGEYPWRCWRLSHLQHMPFVQVSRRIVANWQALMRDIIQ